jgi:predicted enzyme related to lactoylglutathione lyase
MPLNEYESKEALRTATDWLVETDPPGGAAAREGIANVIGLVMMGAIEPNDLDDLASIVEDNGAPMHDPAVPLETHRAQLRDAVKAAFDHVRSQTGR